MNNELTNFICATLGILSALLGLGLIANVLAYAVGLGLRDSFLAPDFTHFALTVGNFVLWIGVCFVVSRTLKKWS